jgi:hypothetical protein
MGNYEVETRGIAWWDTSPTRELEFFGVTYTIDFAELNPDALRFAKVKSLDDHTVELTYDKDERP